MSKAAEDAVRLNQIQTALGAAGAILLFLTLYYTRQAAVAAEDAAKAAQLSASLAETTTRHIERPYLFVSMVDGAYVFEPRNVLGSFFGQADEDKRPNHLALKYVIQNYGRTPAIIEAINISMHILNFSGPSREAIPIEPVYDTDQTVAAHIIIGPEKAGEPNERLFYNDEIREISGGFMSPKFPIVFGFVQYRDIAGRRYQRGFGFTFHGGFGAYRRKYNYDRELQPNEGLVIPPGEA